MKHVQCRLMAYSVDDGLEISWRPSLEVVSLDPHKMGERRISDSKRGKEEDGKRKKEERTTSAI